MTDNDNGNREPSNNLQRVKAMFNAAMEQPAASRLSWLREACDDDENLFHSVAGLLGTDSQTGALSDIVGRAAARLSEINAPAAIGNFEIVGLLGEGGMGDVYLAQRADGEFSQQVAIKVLGTRRPGKELIRRFQAERQILANLDHPNIARLIDGGETGDGLPYLAMEFVSGTPITDYCNANSLSVHERLKLFRKVCAAVENAHRNLVIHRDIKPSNILVTNDGEPKLLDFGIAKLLQPGDLDHTLVETVDSARLMTPRHASPEQIRGDRITIATDIYSLGVLLYELLSGSFPYELPSARPADIERAICDTDPPTPSSRVTQSLSPENTRALAAARGASAGELRRLLDGDLDNIVLTAMQKDPERRYATVRELADDIQNFLDFRPVRARADSFVYRMRKFVRRNQVAVSAAAIAIVAISAAISVSVARIAEERDVAQIERRKAEEVADFMQQIFEVSDPAEALGREITARELLESGARRIRTELQGQPEVQAALLRVLGITYYSLGDKVPAEELLREALAANIEVYGEQSLETAETKLVLGFQVQDNGFYDEATTLLEDSYNTRVAILGYEHFDVVEAISARAFLAEMAGDLDRAEELHREALALGRALTRDDHKYVAESMTKLGGILRILGRNDEAEPLFREAIAMQDRLYQGDHPQTADTKRQLAGLLRELRHFEESEALYREVIDTRVRILGPHHAEVANTWNSYAQLLSDMGKMDEAIQAHENMLGIFEIIYAGPHPSFGAAYNNFAVMLKQQGDLEGALKNYQLSIDMQNAVDLPADHPNRSFPLGGMAGVYLAQKRHAEAAEIFRDVLAMRTAHFPADHRLVSEIKSALGAALTGTGDYDEAEALLLDAAATFEAVQGNSHPGSLLTMDRLIEHYRLRGNSEAQNRWQTLLDESDPELNGE